MCKKVVADYMKSSFDVLLTTSNATNLKISFYKEHYTHPILQQIRQLLINKYGGNDNVQEEETGI
jgi:hypothetical protein